MLSRGGESSNQLGDAFKRVVESTAIHQALGAIANRRGKLENKITSLSYRNALKITSPSTDLIRERRCQRYSRISQTNIAAANCLRLLAHNPPMSLDTSARQHSPSC